MKIRNRKCRPQGIALIQVLMLSVLLSVLMISVVFNSKSQLIDASKIQDRADAMVRLHSQESELLFSLLTHDRRLKADSVLDLPRRWNFYGKPILTVDGQLQIQDVAGYYSIFNIKQMEYILTRYQATPAQILKFRNALKALILPNAVIPASMQRYVNLVEPLSTRRSGIQLVDELRFVEGLDANLYQKISPFLTSYPNKSVNPAAMSEEQMALYVSESSLPVLLALRDEGKLTPAKFEALTGLDFENGVNIVPGSALDLRFTVVLNDVKLSRKMTVVVNPYDVVPFYFWEYQKYSHAN